MPLSLPIVFEEAGHASVGHLPLLDTVFPDLLDGWFCHCLAGAYTKRFTAQEKSLQPFPVLHA
jgi:hypothetical protein|tara:strand:+ start:645 stop:833 length:189 start_codon:yes stop_codon:yes gene_type:complete